MWAAAFGDTEMVKVRPDVSDVFLEKHTLVQILVKAGADIGKREYDFKLTPLHYAAGSAKVEIIEVRHLVRPLFITHVMYPQILLDHGASRTAKDVHGETPYDQICSFALDGCSADQMSTIESMLDPYADRGSGKDHSGRILLIVLPIAFVVLLVVLILGIAYYKGLLKLRRNQGSESAQDQ